MVHDRIDMKLVKIASIIATLIVNLVISYPLHVDIHNPVKQPGTGLYNTDHFEQQIFVDGDMIIRRRKHKSHDRERRLIVKHLLYDWPDATVYYSFDQMAPVNEVLYNFTMDAFEHISNQSCMKFIKRTTQKDFINVTAADSGCYAMVGFYGGPQLLNLAADCDSLSVVVHEIMHALGFLHEHNRLDRNKYVYVNQTNIIATGQDSFNVYDEEKYDESTVQDIPYDKQSVLHYGRYGFSKYEDKFELERKEHMSIYSLTDYKEFLGSTDGLSAKDVIRLNGRYCGADVAATLSTLPTTPPITTSATTKAAPAPTTLPVVATTLPASTTPPVVATTIPTPTTPPVVATTVAQQTSTISHQSATFNSTNWGIPDNSGTSLSINFYSILIGTLAILLSRHIF